MTTPKHLEYAHSRISDVPDFPKPGILFKDITPVLQDPRAFNDAVEDLASHLNGANIVAGIESRGFIFAAAIAAKNNLGLVLLRKPGKLPRETHVVQYQLEYGFDSLEMHQDALDKNDSVLLIDDVLATGGTLLAGSELIAKTGAKLTKIVSKKANSKGDISFKTKMKLSKGGNIIFRIGNKKVGEVVVN